MKLITIISFALVLALASVAQAQGPSGPANQQLANIQLSADALTFQNGYYSAVIIAALTDINNKPFAGANVYFNSDMGTLSTSSGSSPKGWLAITDSNGRASAVLTLSSLANAPATVTMSTGLPGENASIVVGTQKATASVTITSTQTAIATVPPLTPGTPAASETITSTATMPAAMNTTANPTSPRGTPGFELVISLFTIYGALKYIGRK